MHANSAADVPARLEALAALGGLGRDALHAQLGAALQVLVHVRRLPDGRRWVDELRLVRADPATGRCAGVPAIRFVPGGEQRQRRGLRRTHQAGGAVILLAGLAVFVAVLLLAGRLTGGPAASPRVPSGAGRSRPRVGAG